MSAVEHLTQADSSVSFNGYFWQVIDSKNKVVLDAGTGFGFTTSEIAERIMHQNANSTIISVDIDPEAFKEARKQLRRHSLLKLHDLLKLVVFIRADLSHIPIKEEAIDLVVSTRTLADIESFSCRVTRALTEFYRILKKGGKVVASDEYPVPMPSSGEEEIAVLRWQLAKAISHLVGRRHANEILPEDLEFVMRLVGFCECEWAVFKGEKIQKRRINYFVARSTEMCNKIANPHLKQAFVMAIKEVEELYQEKGGVFPPKYVLRATK